MQSHRSICEVLQVLNISLTDKTNLRDSLKKLNFKKTKNYLDLISQDYLMFNNLPILKGD